MIYMNQKLRFKATFRDDQGALEDPTTPVSLTLWDPDDVEHTVTMTRDSLGVFVGEYVVNLPDAWFFRIASPDGRVKEGDFRVQRGRTAP